MHSPISWNQNLIPPTHTHGQIGPSPHQPRGLPLDLTTSTSLHHRLRVAQVRHDPQVSEVKLVGGDGAAIEAFAEPEGLLVGCLRSGG